MTLQPRHQTLLVMALAAALVLWAAPAAARDFAGSVVSVSGATLRVESRMGDSRSFQKGSDTEVSGARNSWSELRSGDSVVVSWSLGDSQAVAHRVRVLSAGSK